MEKTAEQLVICKACKLVIAEKKLGAVCPACGVPRASFEKYSENMSRRRKIILELDLHPIALHLPQAISLLVPFCIFAVMILPANLAAPFFPTAYVLSLLFPLTVCAAFIAGLIDGSTRFKKLKTPWLIKKIILGSMLIVVSIAVAVTAFIFRDAAQSGIYLVMLSIFAIVVEITLAQIGKKLMYAKLPG